MTTDQQIEVLAQKRQTMWATGDTEGIPSIDRQLTDLYEERRIERAKLDRGGLSRGEIVRRATIDQEIERLMSAKS